MLVCVTFWWGAIVMGSAYSTQYLGPQMIVAPGCKLTWVNTLQPSQSSEEKSQKMAEYPSLIHRTVIRRGLVCSFYVAII